MKRIIRQIWKRHWSSVFVLSALFFMFLFVQNVRAENMTTSMIAIDGSTTATYSYDMTELLGLVYIPVHVSKPGESRVDITIANAKETIIAGVSKSREWSVLSDQMFIARANETTDWSRTFKEDTTYYLYFRTSQISSDEEHVIITVKHTFTPATGDGVLKSGKWHNAVQAEDTLYYKFFVPEKGYICLEREGSFVNGTCRLLDKKKKVVSMEEEVVKKVYYGLNPGTYYIRIKNDSKELKVGRYRIKYTFSQVSVPSGPSGGKKLSEAKPLKLGKKVTIFRTSSKKKRKSETTYYKINVPKKKKLYITSQAHINFGGVDFNLYKKDKRTNAYTSKYTMMGTARIDIWGSAKTKTECLSKELEWDGETDEYKAKTYALAAGTYYLEVTNGIDTGFCTFCVK